jgi:ferredoxin
MALEDLEHSTPDGNKGCESRRRAGLAALPVGCRRGGCGVCKVRLLEGEIQAEPMSRAHVGPAERAAGWALACRIRPRSDLVLEAPV